MKGYLNSADNGWMFNTYRAYYNFLNVNSTWDYDKFINILDINNINNDNNRNNWDDFIENWFYINDSDYGRITLKYF